MGRSSEKQQKVARWLPRQPGCLQGAVRCAAGIPCLCPWNKAPSKEAVAETTTGASLKPRPVTEHSGCL